MGGVILSVVLACASWLIGQYALVEHIRQATYEWLQGRLVPPGTLPVAVVDISNLKPEPIPGGDGAEATSREKLIALIKALVAQNPKVIGIDVDFSPEFGQYITPSDPVFFRFCIQQKRKGVPIYLGTFRSQALAPEQRFVQSEFKQLAASLLNPNEPSRIVQWLSPGTNYGKLPTMASALAQAYGSQNPRWPEAMPFLFEAVSEKRVSAKSEVAVGELLADYSPLEKLQENGTVLLSRNAFEDQQRMTDSLDQHRDILEGRMVLVGDAAAGEGADRFVVPGRNIPVPGVDVIACGAYTLASAPLYGIREPWRFLLDAVLAITLLLIVSVVRWRSGQKELSEEQEQRLTKLLIGTTVVILFITAGLLVRWTRVVWDDFLVVSLVLILHPSVEKWISQMRRRMSSKSVRSLNHHSQDERSKPA